MADNINDKHLDNLTKTQLENSSDEIIPTGDLETITPKQGTEIMEVHHHPQVGKKNFKEYFLEFIMIFLAVTLGFLAENIRERISDHSREKDYIVSIIQDMQKDSASLTNYIYKNIPYHSKWLDSEINL